MCDYRLVIGLIIPVHVYYFRYDSIFYLLVIHMRTSTSFFQKFHKGYDELELNVLRVSWKIMIVFSIILT